MESFNLSQSIASKMDLPVEEVNRLMQGFVGLMQKHGESLDSVSIPGFGNFETKIRPERIALHPASGDKLLLPPKVAITFKPSRLLKTKIYGK